MNDEKWLKNLATAHFDQDQWQTSNPKQIEQELKTKIRETIDNLFMEMQDACETYNHYSLSESSMKVLPIEAQQGGNLTGVIVLLGSSQLKVLFEDSCFQVSLINVKNFKSSKIFQGSFAPVFDALGSLYWKSEAGVLMTIELMIKTLLELIVREAGANIKS